MTITAKYDGTCSSCGKSLPAGSEIDWSRENGVRCLDCMAAANERQAAARDEAKAIQKEAAKVARAAAKVETDAYEQNFRETGEFRTAEGRKGRSLFEGDACWKCAGLGIIEGYRGIAGGVCFACGGDGVRLTKRGSAAQAFLRASYELPVSELSVGTKILVEGVPGFTKSAWVEILAIREEDGKFTVEGDGHSLGGLLAENRLRVAQTAEQKREKIAAAIAYQRTLGPNGKPRRR